MVGRGVHGAGPPGVLLVLLAEVRAGVELVRVPRLFALVMVLPLCSTVAGALGALRTRPKHPPATAHPG